jgi:hypothetical protein
VSNALGGSLFALVDSESQPGEIMSKRELIEPNEGDKRFVRRDEEGKFKESDDVSRSLSQDQKRDAQTESKPGEGDRGDRKEK